MENSNKTIIKHIPDFLDYCDIEKGLRNNTQKNYQRYLNKFTNWLKAKGFEGLLPHQLDSDHIFQYRLYLSRGQNPLTHQTLKKSTQNYYLIALRAFLGYYVAKDIISLPPDKITLPKGNKDDKSIKFLSLDQVEKLLTSAEPKTATGIRDRAILETLYSAGIRVSELVGLSVEHVDLIMDR